MIFLYNKVFSYCLGIVGALSIIFVILITSVEVVVYSDSYFKKEYSKYNISENTKISQEDLMYVTNEMMDYLVDKRENLDNIVVKINDVNKEFFNEREKAHMVDVKFLFVKAMELRKICIVIALITIITALWKNNILYNYIKSIRVSVISFFIFMIVLAGVISTNFTKYFFMFHEMFFSNDLWLLDPNTDMLINIVPEPFFIDTSLYICITFIIGSVLLILLTYLFQFIYKTYRN